MKDYKIQQLQKQLVKDYYKVIVPDTKVEVIKRKLWELPQKWIKLVIDYLNRDKYLLVQWIAKTIKSDNFWEVATYLDWALSRIDGLIITFASLIKKKNSF